MPMRSILGFGLITFGEMAKRYGFIYVDKRPGISACGVMVEIL